MLFFKAKDRNLHRVIGIYKFLDSNAFYSIHQLCSQKDTLEKIRFSQNLSRPKEITPKENLGLGIRLGVYTLG